MAYKKSLAARVKRVEAKVARQKPEVKVYTDFISALVATNTLAFLDLGAIVEGTGFNERVGNKIRLHKVEVHGWRANELGLLLLKSKLAADPAITDFEGVYCPTVKGELLNNDYVMLHHDVPARRPYSDSEMCKFSRSWKAGIPVSYDDPTTGHCSHNNMYVVVPNLTASSHSVYLTCRFFYTDC